jgi:hypothetical protein
LSNRPAFSNHAQTPVLIAAQKMILLSMILPFQKTLERLKKSRQKSLRAKWILIKTSAVSSFHTHSIRPQSLSGSQSQGFLAAPRFAVEIQNQNPREDFFTFKKSHAPLLKKSRITHLSLR